MPPIYEDSNTSREKLLELRETNRCQQCGGMLNVFLDVDSGKAFLACNDWHRTHHKGIERGASRYEKEGLASLNLPTRREMMEQDLGKEKTTRLMKYEGVVSLTQKGATEVLETIWPDAPEVEVFKAAMVCHQYGLNPLMHHLFLIPFKRRRQGKVVGEDWVTVLGIKATRLIAHRHGDFSYLDDTPRVMTEDEQKRIYGYTDKNKVMAITKLKDSKGNEASGYGAWPLGEEPYGAEKGNTKANMAFIRSERNALDRLFAGEMPQGIQVVDEEYISGGSIEGEVITPSKGSGEIGETAGKEQGEGEPGATISPPTKDKAQKIGTSAAGKETKSPDEVTEDDIPDLNALCKACFHFWGMQPADVWKELGYKSHFDVTETAWECWQKIKAVKAG